MSSRHYASRPVSIANSVLPLSFDQARLIRHHRYLAANGIDPSGEPATHGLNGLPCSISRRHAPECKGSHPFVTCPYRQALLLHLRATAIQIHLIPDPFVYSSLMVSHAFSGTRKNHSGPSLESFMIDCNGGHRVVLIHPFISPPWTRASASGTQVRRVCA